MRTNIDIDDALLAEAMKAGPYTSKKETVEAGLRLLARQAAYREILKWRGKLRFDADEEPYAVAPAVQHMVAEPAPPPLAPSAPPAATSTKSTKNTKGTGKPRAGR